MQSVPPLRLLDKHPWMRSAICSLTSLQKIKCHAISRTSTAARAIDPSGGECQVPRVPSFHGTIFREPALNASKKHDSQCLCPAPRRRPKSVCPCLGGHIDAAPRLPNSECFER
jgi:hypothetical protein